MRKFASSFILVIIYATSSFAGFQRGNGGNVVLCKDETRLLFLDYYLFTRQLKGSVNPPPLTPYSGSADMKALNMAKPISEYFPELWDRIAESIQNFQQEAWTIPNMPKVVIIDEGLSPILETYNCEMYQLIVQQERPTAEGIRYLISKPHWDALSVDQKAVAVLHEAILKEYIGKEGFYDKDPIQIIVKGLLGYALFKDKAALKSAITELGLSQSSPPQKPFAN